METRVATCHSIFRYSTLITSHGVASKMKVDEAISIREFLPEEVYCLDSTTYGVLIHDCVTTAA